MPEPIDRRALLTGALAGCTLMRAAGAAPAAPNILHIMTDQQQWATIAGRSECRTPNLNRLADSGMTFERSYTPSAVCCPARAMILSGAYHWHNGVYNQVHSPPSVHRDMNADAVLYSQRLRDAGYRLGYVGKWHASYVRTPLDFGFHEVADLEGCDPKLIQQLNTNPDRVERARGLRTVAQRQMQWPGSQPFTMWGYREGPEEATSPYYRAECAIRMMRRFARARQPWHLEVQFVEPHDPYLPLKQYLDRYDPAAIRVPANFSDTFEGKPGMHRREAETWGHVTPDDYRNGRAHYYAFTEQVDAQIGRVLDALRESGQEENTIVVATTDHGDMAGAHRMWIKGWLPYEETYRVPLIVRWPGRTTPGGRSDLLVQTHDLAHTYVAAAGARPMPYADGRSLLPLLEDPRDKAWRDQILCAYYGGEYLYTQRMAITDRFKYVFNGFDIDECYDLAEDAGEMRNLVATGEKRANVDDMRARLYELMNQFDDPYGDLKQASAPMRGDRYCAPRYLPRGKRLG
ncbi:MAG: sulfatase-like hydrolase/transferase [Candidatus Sulfopaludibacter sp.]|nr:sulfatase-like hydrolase/transferase [Candidatus Sulfopaludibacter sp.]